MTRALPRVALGVFVVGLALHNLVMAELWDLGVRGAALDVVAAWKDVLLAAALAAALWGARTVPLSLWADRLALAFAAVVVVYWLLPQSWLGGEATTRGQLFALRHDLLPVAAYFLGRLLVLAPREWRRLSLVLVGIALALVGVGARRRVPGAVAVVARLGGAGLVRGAARARLQGPLGVARELGAEYRRRAEPGPPARLHVPQPARHRLPARRRAALPRRPPTDPLDRRSGGHRLRGAPVDPHARRLPRPGRRPRRAGGRAAPVAARDPRRRLPRSSESASSRPSRTSAPRRATRRRSSRTCASRGRRTRRTPTRSAAETPPPRAT